MKARKKQPGVTRQLILEAAGRGFATQGYAATGIGGIVETAGLTKGALYHHFADKRELALAWIRETLREQLVADWVSPFEGLGSLRELIAACSDGLKQLRDGDACTALVAMAAELGGRESDLGAALEELFALWRDSVAQVLRHGQQQGWVHSSIRPDKEAGILISMISGFSVLLRCNDRRGEWTDSLSAYLETLRPA